MFSILPLWFMHQFRTYSMSFTLITLNICISISVRTNPFNYCQNCIRPLKFNRFTLQVKVDRNKYHGLSCLHIYSTYIWNMNILLKWIELLYVKHEDNPDPTVIRSTLLLNCLFDKDLRSRLFWSMQAILPYELYYA